VDNRLILQAGIASKEQLRYTPAGIAVLSFTVEHHSNQREAGQPRDVSLTLDCVAIGDKAQSLDGMPTGRELELTGFLSNRSKKSRWVVFHVTEFDLK
jgi:primosomal replication protein N